MDSISEPGLMPAFDYMALSGFASCQAIRAALTERPWMNELAKADAYAALVIIEQFYLCHRHRRLWPEHPQPLRNLTLVRLARTMASQFATGQIEQATHIGRLSYAALSRSSRHRKVPVGYDPSRSYVLDDGEDWQKKGVYYGRRAQAFILRLFGEWNGIAREWRPYAYEVPVYEWLLKHWRIPDPQALIPALLVVADRHTHESRDDTRKVYHDFQDVSLYRYPLEILMLYRLRQLEGLANPVLDHPLCQPPFDRLPDPNEPYMDDLMEGSLKRIRRSFPDFDSVIEEAIADPLHDPHIT